MPVGAAIMAGSSIASALASIFGGGGGGGGKLAKQWSQYLKGLTSDQLGNLAGVFDPAADYWRSILAGGPEARMAVAPAAMNIREGYGAARKNIETFLPRGGERNLATARSFYGEQGDLAGLYAGVQPEAARQLAILSGIPAGIASSAISGGTAAAGTAANFSLARIQQQMESGQGIGAVLYNLMRSKGRGNVGPVFGTSASGIGYPTLNPTTGIPM